jgi:hypothetical protein
MSANRYIRFVENSRIPLFSTKYSPKTYTQHQSLLPLLLKEYLSEDYRDTSELVEITDSLRGKFQVDPIPHFTTIRTFCQRIRASPFTHHLNQRVKMVYDWGERINCTAVDSSGFTGSYVRHYYSWRTGKTRKRFLNTSISVDTDRQIITGFKISQHQVHDLPCAEKLLTQCHQLNSCAPIPVRTRKRKRISGYYRRRISQAFDDDKYHQRNKVETVFSFMKRKFREVLKARLYHLQVKEIKFKMILYNLSRMITSLLVLVSSGFLQSLQAHTGRVKVFRGFTWKSDDHIGGNCNIRVKGPKYGYDPGKSLVVYCFPIRLRIRSEPDWSGRWINRKNISLENASTRLSRIGSTVAGLIIPTWILKLPGISPISWRCCGRETPQSLPQGEISCAVSCISEAPPRAYAFT